ncbi:hypothetical protein AL037_20790 [Salipiger aestuarii]|nr:hypothetical protein AL037_20790 [Salipiger aestuarii]
MKRRLAVQDHHFERHRQGGGQAVQHHANAVANKHHVAFGIGGQANQRRSTLAVADVTGGMGYLGGGLAYLGP